MSNFFKHIYHSFLKHPLIFRIGLLIFVGILAFTASRITFNEDISKLIPTTAENEMFQKVVEQVDFSDKIIVQISQKDKGTTADLVKLADSFIDSLAPYNPSLIKDVQGRVSEDTALETFDFVYDHLPLFLDEDDYRTINRQLEKDSVYATVNRNYDLLVSPRGLIAKNTIIRDPLGISLLGLNKLKAIGLQQGFIIRDGYLMSENEAHLLLFISPKFKTANTKKNQVLAETLYRLQNKINREFAGTATLSLYGGSLIAVSNAKQIKRDIQVTIAISVSLLLLILIVFYKKITVPVLLFLPTLIGALLGASVLFLIRGEISAISLGVGSILIGISLDYSLHLLTHIRNNGNSEHLFTTITKPILLSSATTALAFLCLLFLRAPALQDLGIFAAVSVLGASVAALLIIPQLYKGKGLVSPSTTFLDRVAAYPFHRNNILLVVIFCVVIGSAFTFQKVGFNKDLTSLNYVSPDLKKTETQLDSLLNVSSNSLYVTAYSEDPQIALEKNEQLSLQLKSLADNETIIRYNSVALLGISNKIQKQRIERWNHFWNSQKKDSLFTNLVSGGQQVGMKPKAFTEFESLLKKDFKTIPLAAFRKLNALPVDEFVTETKDLTTVTTLVKFKEENRPLLEAAFLSEENVLLIDRQALNETLMGTLKNNFNTLLFYCSIAIAIVLLLFYRNIKITLVTLLPIILTWWVTLGIMGLLNLEFNVLNVIVSSFVFGLGVDFCIFMTNGLLEGKPNAIATYKTAILLSVLTTLLGMGALIFAKHPALYSISLISMIGISSALLISFILQPVLYRLLIFKGQKKKESTLL